MRLQLTDLRALCGRGSPQPHELRLGGRAVGPEPGALSAQLRSLLQDGGVPLLRGGALSSEGVVIRQQARRLGSGLRHGSLEVLQLLAQLCRPGLEGRYPLKRSSAGLLGGGMAVAGILETSLTLLEISLKNLVPLQQISHLSSRRLRTLRGLVALRDGHLQRLPALGEGRAEAFEVRVLLRGRGGRQGAAATTAVEDAHILRDLALSEDAVAHELSLVALHGVYDGLLQHREALAEDGVLQAQILQLLRGIPSGFLFCRRFPLALPGPWRQRRRCARRHGGGPVARRRLRRGPRELEGLPADDLLPRQPRRRIQGTLGPATKLDVVERRHDTNLVAHSTHRIVQLSAAPFSSPRQPCACIL
mmetsp:Transcript_124389/g.398348  ORF Transcript_124389/g.398348 Transcript_124389/m.398348 type:complete len:362 (+) Transcript_124389:1619-2704(+)